MSEYRVVRTSSELDFSKLPGGLVPVICIDDQASSIRAVLMVGFANSEAIDATLQTASATFWSRSRQAIWKKGETSGNVLRVKGVYADCDRDSVVYLVGSQNPACHTGAATCFQIGEKKEMKYEAAEKVANRCHGFGSGPAI